MPSPQRPYRPLTALRVSVSSIFLTDRQRRRSERRAERTTARGLKTDRADRIIADMAALSDFLDRCVGGGSSIMNRWRAEGLELE